MDEPEYPPGIPRLKEVFSDNTYQLTGVAVSKEGRLFTNYPLWSDIYKYAVVEVKGDSQSLPYPDLAMNTGMDKAADWICVQAVHVDDSNSLWVVDPASPRQQGVVDHGQKLVKMDLTTNTVVRTYPLAGPTDDQSYINDVRVDRQTHTAYLTNSTEGGIVVVDLISGTARQVLQGTPGVTADPNYTLTIDGHPVMKNGAPFKANSDGIALTPDGGYLYFKPLTDDKLYRIKTEALRDTSLSTTVLASKVEYLGRFTTTDGMIFDRKGNLYLGDLERYRIVKIDKDLHMSVVLEDKRLIWPDSYQVSDDGYLYISCSQIHRQPEYNNGINKRTSPYKIYRLKLPGN
jgi:sugar lactone lactonase YvrE